MVRSIYSLRRQYIDPPAGHTERDTEGSILLTWEIHRSHTQTPIIYKPGFNQNYHTLTLILPTKIVLCSKCPWTNFMNYECFVKRSCSRLYLGGEVRRRLHRPLSRHHTPPRNNKPSFTTPHAPSHDTASPLSRHQKSPLPLGGGKPGQRGTAAPGWSGVCNPCVETP